MHSHSPVPLWLSLLLSDLEPSRQIPTAQALEALASHGSSGERCLARVALDLWNQTGLLSEIVWALDERNFRNLVRSLQLLRKT